jgi:hypothetical protein
MRNLRKRLWLSQGALDHPTPPSKPFARLHAVARDTSCDASVTQPSPMCFRKVSPIDVQLTWTFASTACQPFNWRD